MLFKGVRRPGMEKLVRRKRSLLILFSQLFLFSSLEMMTEEKHLVQELASVPANLFRLARHVLTDDRQEARTGCGKENLVLLIWKSISINLT